MPKPDHLISSESRPDRARAADRYQEQLANQRQRLFAGVFLGLVLAESCLWLLHAPEWLLLLISIGWLGFLIHNNALLVLHELWEINDQIAGRKDEFFKGMGAKALE